MRKPFAFYLITFLIASCKPGAPSIPQVDQKISHQYWHQGKAEINSYNFTTQLNTISHKGTLTMVCIPENLSKSKLQKLDASKKVKTDIVEVLRCNFHYTINSGMNEYSMMTAVYMPFNFEENPHSLKVTTGIQEWNGQSFTELLWKGHRYEHADFSYLESSPSIEKSLANTWLEDELWCKIRIAPGTLPIGKIRMTPSSRYTRLYNHTLKVYEAESTLVKEGSEYKYSVEYAELKRKVDIHFKTDFPHLITKWKEYQDGKEIASGDYIKTIQAEYWKEAPGDATLRDSLFIR